MRNCYFLLLLVSFLLSFCAPTPDQGSNHREKTPTNANTAPDGMTVFRQNCVLCHGADGKLGLNGAKDLTVSTKTPEERILMITNGKNLMTPFKGILNEAQIKAVAAYTLTLKK